MRYFENVVSLTVTVDLTRGRLIVGQFDAGRGVEVAPFERVESARASQPRRAYHHPPTPRSRNVRIPRRLEHVRIVDGDAVKKRAVRENRVPGFFQAGHPASANVVDLRVTVEHLEQPVVANLLQLVAA